MNLIILTTKSMVNLIAWLGFTLAIDQEFLGSRFIDKLEVSPILANIIVGIAAVFWIIKAAWYFYEHFYLERRERLIGIEKSKRKKSAQS